MDPGDRDPGPWVKTPGGAAVDELRLRRLARSGCRGDVLGSGGRLPTAVEGGYTKPCFLLLCVWPDHDTGIILHTHLATPDEGLGRLQTSGIEFYPPRS